MTTQANPNPTPNPTLFQQFNKWLKESTGLKLFVLGFMLLILLIPLSQIESLMHERQYRSTDAVQEVSNKWSRSQTLAGPIVALPYETLVEVSNGKGETEIIKKVKEAYFLPENLQITGSVEPGILHRGIFDVVVYTSSLQFKGNFMPFELQKLKIDPENVRWEDAYLIVGLDDLRGIQENPVIQFGKESMTAEPGETQVLTNKNAIIAPLSMAENLEGSTPFTFSLQMKGSQELNFLPTGKTSQVQLSGSWPSPSFVGEFLPETREIDENGFSANWKILHFNRPFPQQWSSTNPVNLSSSSFGVNLLMGVNQYQKSIRTAKYGILIVFLTFLALFLIELIYRYRIHLFQYVLIAAALTIYYTLIVSISEHIGFNLAYTIASVATIILISLYATTFLAKKMAGILAGLLSLFYGFVYALTQQEDYALLIGSIGLFLVVAILMYISKNINWQSEAAVPPAYPLSENA